MTPFLTPFSPTFVRAGSAERALTGGGEAGYKIEMAAVGRRPVCCSASRSTRRIDKKETAMPRCYCRFVLALLVIVFAWWSVSWAKIALTVLGGLLAVLALVGTCCCSACKREIGKAEPGRQQQAAK